MRLGSCEIHDRLRREAMRRELTGLDERLRHETGMPVVVADNPLHSVAIGSGRCVEQFDALRQVLVAESRR